MGSRAAISVLVVLAALLAAAPAGADPTPDVFVVGSASDGAGTPGSCGPAADAQCTLRGAVARSNTSVNPDGSLIKFGAGIGTSTPITLSSSVVITRTVQIQGCAGPGGPPCVGVERNGTWSEPGLKITSDDVTVSGLALTGFAVAVQLLGSDNSEIQGNWFGVRRDATTSGAANGIGILVVGDATTNPDDPAQGDTIGGAGSATGDDAECSGTCNLIANSTVAGISLDRGGAGEIPAGGEDFGVSIQGNWIGLAPNGTALANAVGIAIGGAVLTKVGYFADQGGAPVRGNVISGNGVGVTQTGSAWVDVIGDVFGLTPDGLSPLPNQAGNAEFSGPADTDGITVGPPVDNAPGLALGGPNSQVVASWFVAPGVQRFQQAAVLLGPGADNSQIGTTIGSAMPNGCLPPPLGTDCTIIGGAGAGVPGILIRGASNVRVYRTSVGGTYSGGLPTTGPPIRIEDAGGEASSGITIGGDVPAEWNELIRLSGPAVQVAGNAQGVQVKGNTGLAVNDFAATTGIFTDLLPAPGFGNSGPVNGGIQPPLVTLADTTGIAGKGAAPGATIRGLVREAPDPPGEPDTIDTGATFPTQPATATADGNGNWEIVFDEPVREGQALLVSQTTASGSSSEYAELGAEPQPDPIAQITSGPTGLVTDTSAAFTFTSTTAPVSFECSLDGAAFSACTSPAQYANLEPGGHQFRVRAVALNVPGPPASRNWTIELPGVTTAPGTKTPLGTSAGAGGTGVNPSSASLALSAVVTLPSAKACVSRRALKIRLRKPKGTSIAFVKIDVPGRATKTVRGKALSAPVNLRGLPKGRFTVRLRVTLLDGRVIKGSRTFRTCAPKRR